MDDEVAGKMQIDEGLVTLSMSHVYACIYASAKVERSNVVYVGTCLDVLFFSLNLKRNDIEYRFFVIDINWRIND